MKIDIGPEGKIVGTKRVAADGQVAGLQGYAGKEVLIVVPEGPATFRLGARDYLLEWQKMAERGARLAQEQAKMLKSRMLAPQATFAEFRRMGEELPAQAIQRVKKQLRARGLPTKVPTAEEARRLLQKQLVAVRREKRVKQAEKWLRAQLKPVSSPKKRRAAA